jgi:magnesium chelatase family protein
VVLATTVSFTLNGFVVDPVGVEVDVARGLPAFQMVGLPDTAVREARERVRAAVDNSGFGFPLSRITASLIPADLRKAGPGLDLAIAFALITASGDLPSSCLDGWALVGGLSLDGTLQPVRGALAIAEAARSRGMRGVILPEENGSEAALMSGIEVRSLGHLSELRALAEGCLPGSVPPAAALPESLEGPDLADLRGQPGLRVALEVAAAGGHGLLMIGPPGVGKSLAARRLPSILPPLSPEEVLEVTKIAGICGVGPSRVGDRPFRAPHHTVSPAGLVGGGVPTRPGEITLAHRGVLFLDELCEFGRATLEALREPLETGEVTISRASGSQTLPASFTLIAASNPCPCGRGPSDPECRCTPVAVERYRSTLSGALADRIDMNVAVSRPDFGAMSGCGGEASSEVRERVSRARRAMEERLGPGRCNADASAPEIEDFHCEDGSLEVLEKASRSGSFNGRTHHRVLKLARTLADLANSETVRPTDIKAALHFRRRDA